MTPIITRLQLAEAALLKNGFMLVDDVWTAAPQQHAQAGMPAVTVDTPEFREVARRHYGVLNWNSLIAHIDAHTAQAVSQQPAPPADAAPNENDWLVQNLMRTLFQVRGHAESVYLGAQADAWQKADFSNCVSLGWPSEYDAPTDAAWIAVHDAANNLLKNYKPHGVKS